MNDASRPERAHESAPGEGVKVMPITYIRFNPFPKCRTCGKRMFYWIPGQSDKDAEHPECYGRRLAQETLKFMKDVLKE